MITFKMILGEGVHDTIWYHGSNKPVKKFLFSMVGKNTSRLSNYHGYGIYFIDDITRAKLYGDVVTAVTITKGADILENTITSHQLLKVYRQLLKDKVTLLPSDPEWYTNPPAGDQSILNNVEEFYQYFTRAYSDSFKNSKDVTEFLLRGGIDGIRVVNDVGDNILVVFNQNIVNIASNKPTKITGDVLPDIAG